MTHRVTLAGLMLLLPVQASAAVPQGLSVSNGWFAVASQTPVIGFFSIRNTGSQPQLVTGWQSPGCHAMHLEEANGGGQGSSSGLTVPPESRMAFVRGSYHLSCDGPSATLQAGSTVPVTFSFSNGGKLTAPFAVRDVGAHRPGQAAGSPNVAGD